MKHSDLVVAGCWCEELLELGDPGGQAVGGGALGGRHAVGVRSSTWTQ